MATSLARLAEYAPASAKVSPAQSLAACGRVGVGLCEESVGSLRRRCARRSFGILAAFRGLANASRSQTGSSGIVESSASCVSASCLRFWRGQGHSS
jgi:hypothetical protein